MRSFKRPRKKLDEETSYWLSYSDMMAALLLIFVLIISVTMLRAKVQFDEKQDELLGKEEELIIQSDALKDERQTVASQQELLDEQAKKLSSQQTELREKEETLRRQHELLDELQAVMSEQQAQLDKIIGVRSELVEALKTEFDDSDLSIAVDEQTGAITFDASILFGYNQDTLKATGKDFLDEFLPRYVNILLGPKYKDYVSEIMIEGHTDTEGTYIYNLELSQKRAFSVAKYCLTKENNILTESQLENLQNVISVNGRSYSSPILDANGEVDADASRRVEFLFRLKDEEMIREMIEILNSEKSN
ncbi:MAG: OmpA family protein [Lachnospiraceae bacterium]|nr:OmpA family protein [Lachnospiraceae bacterium]